jgi:hypothetical protein
LKVRHFVALSPILVVRLLHYDLRAPQSLNSDRIKVNIAIDHERALPLDGSTQVGLESLDLEMVMIAHQDVGMNP